jgi:alkylated DNA nucleotide flippase Atl1
MRARAGWSYGLMAAMIASGAVAQVSTLSMEERSKRWPSPCKRAPNAAGPVTDSTKESKRARRRRLAKERQP